MHESAWPCHLCLSVLLFLLIIVNGIANKSVCLDLLHLNVVSGYETVQQS